MEIQGLHTLSLFSLICSYMNTCHNVSQAGAVKCMQIQT